MAYLDSLFSLEGETALVTGGATGIGRMIAEALAMAGARVLIASRKAAACEAAAAEIAALGAPGAVEAFAGDVGAEDGCAALAAETMARAPSLDILVNNAGISWGAPLEAFPHAQWERVNAVNVAGVFTLTQRLLPALRAAATDASPARVLNIGSVMGVAPMGDGAYSYAVSKAGVIHLTRILARELAGERITVNALAPGPFRSKMTAFATADPEKAERLGASLPLGRIGAPSDIAGAALFLCGRAGAYVTGAVLPLDGGAHVATGGDLFAAAAE